MTRSTAAAACLALTTACTGQIGGPAPIAERPGSAGPDSTSSTGPGGTGSTGSSGTGSGGGTGGVNPPAMCSAITDVDDTPLRRLTNADYLNTVSDLLGDVSSLNL